MTKESSKKDQWFRTQLQVPKVNDTMTALSSSYISTQWPRATSEPSKHEKKPKSEETQQTQTDKSTKGATSKKSIKSKKTSKNEKRENQVYQSSKVKAEGES